MYVYQFNTASSYVRLIMDVAASASDYPAPLLKEFMPRITLLLTVVGYWLCMPKEDARDCDCTEVGSESILFLPSHAIFKKAKE